MAVSNSLQFYKCRFLFFSGSQRSDVSFSNKLSHLNDSHKNRSGYSAQSKVVTQCAREGGASRSLCPWEPAHPITAGGAAVLSVSRARRQVLDLVGQHLEAGCCQPVVCRGKRTAGPGPQGSLRGWLCPHPSLSLIAWPSGLVFDKCLKDRQNFCSLISNLIQFLSKKLKERY